MSKETKPVERTIVTIGKEAHDVPVDQVEAFKAQFENPAPKRRGAPGVYLKAEPQSEPEADVTFVDLNEELGKKVTDSLRAAGLDTPEKLRYASDAEILACENVGDATLARIRQAYPKAE